MMTDPRQIDLEGLIHYQDDPAFIGPRLPKDHPTYRAQLAQPPPRIASRVPRAHDVAIACLKEISQ